MALPRAVTHGHSHPLPCGGAPDLSQAGGGPAARKPPVSILYAKVILINKQINKYIYIYIYNFIDRGVDVDIDILAG